MDDRAAMAHALDLAWRGWGRVHPNPLVGAVVVADGLLVGEGFHAEFGQAHAEAVALAQAGDRARGATLVVTLAPCGHRGKQPPCAEAVVAAGIRRVVVALADPNPLAGGGIARLRAAGVDVEVGVLADQAAQQNAAFLHRFGSAAARPWVALKLATSLDGRIADHAGRSRWLSGEPARAYVQWLRAGFDAVAVGGATARADDPALTARGTVAPRVPPRRVVFAGRDGLPSDLTLLRTARETPTVVVLPLGSDPGAARTLEGMGVTVVTATGLSPALEQLVPLGLTSLLVEGGGRLAGALMAENLVDRCYWIQSPLWLGDAARPSLAGMGPVALADQARWLPVERRALGQDTLLVVDREPCSPAS